MSNGNSSTPSTPAPAFETIATFDRLLGSLEGRPGVDKTKPTTIVALVDVVGKASTFIVQTYRERDADPIGKPERSRDTIFLQQVDALGSYRIVIPAEVADTIARQREALSTKGRKRGARSAAERRAASGVVSGFAAMTPEQRRAARKKAKAARAAKAAKRAARRAAKAGG